MQLVFRDKLKSGMIVGENVYATGNTGAPLIRKNTVLTSSLIQLLEEHKISFVRVSPRIIRSDNSDGMSKEQIKRQIGRAHV